MSKLFLFFILTYILGNPLIAILVVLVLLYVLDRRFIGLFPNLFKPLQRSRRMAKLRQSIRLNPHDTSAKHDLARILMEKGRYREALEWLESIRPILDESSEVLAEIGICLLKLQRFEEGESFILQAIDRHPRVMYGEPYLQLGEALAGKHPDQAIHYLKQFHEIQSSSCLGYYRLAQLYKQLGRKSEANEAYHEIIDIYRTLPKYKRRSERRWYVMALLKSMTSGNS